MIFYPLRIFSTLIFNKILKLPFLKFKKLKNYFFPSLGTSPIHRHHFVAFDANHCWEKINGEEGNLDLMKSILTSFCLIMIGFWCRSCHFHSWKKLLIQLSWMEDDAERQQQRWRTAMTAVVGWTVTGCCCG